MTTADEFPYLPIEDEVSMPFWSATRKKQLVIQWCPLCERFQWYPRAVCIICGSENVEWKITSGKGVVDSFTVVHRAPNEGFVPPYVIARVLLSENVLILTRLVNDAEVDPKCGDEVSVMWQELSDGRFIPVFG
jgi:hypothetical protein